MARIHGPNQTDGSYPEATIWTGETVSNSPGDAFAGIGASRDVTQIHWLTAVNGLFTDASDWTGDVVPGPSDDAMLDAAGGKFTVTAEAVETVNSLQLSHNARLVVEAQFTAAAGTGSGANAGKIIVRSGGTLKMGGVIDNAGLIALKAGEEQAAFLIDAAEVSLVGGGTITLSDHNGNASGIYLANGASLTNVDNTIIGAGHVTVSTNSAGGVIDATGRMYAGVAINEGLVEATGSGGLLIYGLNGTIENAGGVILAGAGSGVELFETIEGGTLAGSGVFSGAGTLDGERSPVTNDATLYVGEERYFNILGEIVNDGSIDVRLGGLNSSGNTTLTGGGSISLYRSFLGDDRNDGGSLTNVDNTISGSGTLGGYHTDLVNEAGGVIDGSGLTIEFVGAVVTNAGLIEATSSAGLTIESTTINNTGTILAGAGSTLELLGVDIQGGALEAGAAAQWLISGAGNVLDGTTNAVENQADVLMGTASTLTIEGAVVNSGTISLSSSSEYLVIGTPGVTLSGGGAIVLSGLRNYIEGATAAATLVNAGDTIEGNGHLGAGVMSLTNEAGGTIEATNATALAINLGANTLVNAGLIVALGVTAQEVIAGAVANTGTLEAAGGTLTVNGAVTGSGLAVITAGALAFTSSFDEAVTFDGTGGELQLFQSQAFTNTITGFSASGATSLDLRDIGFVGSGEATFSGTVSGGTLTVTDGTHTAHIFLSGDYLGDTFTASSDGNGGTGVVATSNGGGPTQLHWLSAVDGLFTDAADWTADLVPGPSDDAILDASGGAFTVTVNVGEAVHSVQLAANATLDVEAQFTASAGTGTGVNAGTISVDDGGTLTMGEALDNSGLITLGAQQTKTKLVIDSAGVSLVGGGMITLAEVSANTAGIYLAKGATLTNLNDTISGAGSVNVSVNKAKGVIDATGGQLALYAEVGVNQGLLESSGSSKLVLEGNINNAGGVVMAGPGSTVELDRATIEGGTFSGSGEIFGYDGTIDGRTSLVTNAGTIFVYHNVYTGFDITILGTIANENFIEIGSNGTLACGASTTLIGGGTVEVGGYFGSTSGNVSLTNVDNTIIGNAGGTLGGANTTLINEAGGIISGVGLVIESASSTMTNAGLIEATNTLGYSGYYGFALKIVDTTIHNSGTILAQTNSTVALSGTDIQGGTIASNPGGVVNVYHTGSVLDGTANAIDSDATISVQYAATLTIEGAIVNSGSIDVTSSSTLVIGKPGVTLSGAGTLVLSGSSGVVEGANAAAALVNAGDLIEGDGQLGDGVMSLTNQAGGTIAATTSTALVINLGANTLINAGLIEALGVTAQGVISSAVANTGTLEATGGTLTVDGAVTGSGQAVITSGTLAFASSFDEAVDFTGTGGELQLAQSQAFTNTITGFSADGATTLDLRDIGFVGSGEATFSGTMSGGTLTVTDGSRTAHIALVGDFLGDTFTASSDGNGGTNVVATGGGGGPTQLHWLSAVDGLFTDAADWTANLVPGPSDDAILDASGGAFTVTATVAETAHSIQLAANATLHVGPQFKASDGTGTGVNAGTIDVGDGATLTAGGVIDNTGLIALSAHYASNELVIDAAGVSLVGGGTITLTEFSHQYADRIALDQGDTLNNVDNTIAGAGYVTVSDNQENGVIDATDNLIALYATVAVNGGMIEASNGAQLDLGGTIKNTGGVILAGAGSEVVLSKATIEAGTLAGSGSILAFADTLDGRYSPVTNASMITVDGFSYMDLLGKIANQGVIQMRGEDTLTTSGATTLTGGGSLLVSGDTNTWKNFGSLTNVNNTIAGDVKLTNYGTIVNEAGGVIDGDGMALYLSSSGGGMTNAGLIEASSSNGLVIAGGTIDNSGVILAGPGSKLILGDVQVDGGTLESGENGKIVLGASDVLDGTVNTIVNQARLEIFNGIQVTMQGAMANSGTITLTLSKHGAPTNLIVGSPGLTLTGRGMVKLQGAEDVVKGTTAASTLTNAGNIIEGGGQLGDGVMGLANEASGTIEADISAALVINLGANTLTNAGVIETTKNAQAVIESATANSGTLYAGGDQLTFDDAVTGSGEAVISAGTLAFASSFSEAVTFAGSGELQLAQSQTFTNTITGFSASGATSLDLRDIGFVGAGEATFSGTMSGGTLTVTDGTHTANIALDGDYLGDTFTAASDKEGGTSVTAEAPLTPQASPLAFVSAMAQFGGSAMNGYRLGEAWWGRETMIYAPRAAMA
jgi:hypothetical protein